MEKRAGEIAGYGRHGLAVTTAACRSMPTSSVRWDMAGAETHYFASLTSEDISYDVLDLETRPRRITRSGAQSSRAEHEFCSSGALFAAPSGRLLPIGRPEPLWITPGGSATIGSQLSSARGHVFHN